MPTLIPFVLDPEKIHASQYSYEYSCSNLTECSGSLRKSQAKTVNNISAQNVNTAPIYGLLHLDHHILLAYTLIGTINQGK